MDACRESIQSLLDHSEADWSLLGVTLVGSFGEGYGHEHWDIDLELVVTKDRYEEIKRIIQRIIHTEKYDLIFTTIDRFQRSRNRTEMRTIGVTKTAFSCPIELGNWKRC